MILMQIANSLAAVQSGVRQIQGTSMVLVKVWKCKSHHTNTNFTIKGEV